jgi:hypothetical protein
MGRKMNSGQQESLERKIIFNPIKFKYYLSQITTILGIPVSFVAQNSTMKVTNTKEASLETNRQKVTNEIILP